MGFIGDHLGSVLRRITRRRRFPLVVRRCDATFVLDPKNWADRQIAMWRPYEAPQLAHARTIIENEKLSTLIDVGANFGLYTILLGGVAEIQRVLSFEPVRRNYAQLLANVFVNRLEMKVDPYRLALGDQSCEALIHVDPRSTAVSRFVPSLEGRRAEDFAHREVVPVAPLDAVVTTKGSRSFVKIDVEGHAAAVVRGAREFLAHNEAVLQVELFEEERVEVIELLRSLGYVPMEAFGSDQYFRRIR